MIQVHNNKVSVGENTRKLVTHLIIVSAFGLSQMVEL